MNIGVGVWVGDHDENFFDLNECFPCGLRRAGGREGPEAQVHQRDAARVPETRREMAHRGLERGLQRKPRSERSAGGGGHPDAIGRRRYLGAGRRSPECRIAALKGMPLLFEAIENKVDELLRGSRSGRSQAEKLL